MRSYVLFLVLGLALSAMASAVETTCSSCSDCSEKLNSYDVVKLTEEIKNHSESCIGINANNVELDCQGHLVDGNNSGYGIRVNGENNTITNCTITDFNQGIYLNNSANNNVLSDNKIKWNGNGIQVSYAESNEIINNVINSNSNGISLQYSSSNIIQDNNISLNQYGIKMDYSTSDTFTNNIINLNTLYGVFSQHSLFPGITMNSNHICYNGESDLVFLLQYHQGTDNYCDSPGGWTDDGLPGCRYNCAGVSTTTSTTSTTSIPIACEGDADGDGQVGHGDLLILAVSYNTVTGDPNYDSRADFNSDGDVDHNDLLVLAVNYGSSCE